MQKSAGTTKLCYKNNKIRQEKLLTGGGIFLSPNKSSVIEIEIETEKKRKEERRIACTGAF